RDWPDGALDGVGVDLDAAVIEEAAQAFPVAQTVADRFGQRRASRQPSQLFVEPRLQRLDQWPRSRLPPSTARVGRLAADLGLDSIQRADTLQRVAGDRRVPTLGDVVEAAPEVRPAQGEGERTAGAYGIGERAVGGIAIDLQDTGEAGEQR